MKHPDADGVVDGKFCRMLSILACLVRHSGERAIGVRGERVDAEH